MKYACSVNDTNSKHITGRWRQRDVVDNNSDVECICDGNAVRDVAGGTVLRISCVEQHLAAVVHQRPSTVQRFSISEQHCCISFIEKPITMFQLIKTSSTQEIHQRLSVTTETEH